ncbi:hypothetical protein GCM10022416_62100 [Actinomadura keratinilytica]|uniref:Helix-turn-helix domain-containing protein n=1 Tax=Actinomadura keratinilytica TaxID=547461 RepID=A0ABP6ULP9_9ACTN
MLALRRAHRIGPLRLAARTGLAPSTAHRILVRHRLPPLAACDRGHRRTHPPLASTNAPATWSTSTSRNPAAPPGRRPGTDASGHAAGRVDRHRDGGGHLYPHTALDDHSRPAACTESMADESAATCAGFPVRATQQQDHWCATCAR